MSARVPSSAPSAMTEAASCCCNGLWSFTFIQFRCQAWEDTCLVDILLVFLLVRLFVIFSEDFTTFRVSSKLWVTSAQPNQSQVGYSDTTCKAQNQGTSRYFYVFLLLCLDLFGASAVSCTVMETWQWCGIAGCHSPIGYRWALTFQINWRDFAVEGRTLHVISLESRKSEEENIWKRSKQGWICWIKFTQIIERMGFSSSYSATDISQ